MDETLVSLVDERIQLMNRERQAIERGIGRSLTFQINFQSLTDQIADRTYFLFPLVK